MEGEARVTCFAARLCSLNLWTKSYPTPVSSQRGSHILWVCPNVLDSFACFTALAGGPGGISLGRGPAPQRSGALRTRELLYRRRGRVRSTVNADRVDGCTYVFLLSVVFRGCFVLRREVCVCRGGSCWQGFPVKLWTRGQVLPTIVQR